MNDTLSLGSPEWIVPAVILVGVGAMLVAFSYARSRGSRALRLSAAFLKLAGLVALGLCLVEPLVHTTRPRPGANLFAILADNSQSLEIKDDGSQKTRGEVIAETLEKDAPWRTRLGQDFDVRTYTFDRRLLAVDDFESLSFDGPASSLSASLSAISERFRGRPLAGILVFTDGIATDLDAGRLGAKDLPPVYPVLASRPRPPRQDLAIAGLSVTQSNFESAPVTILATVAQRGFRDREILTELVDADGKTVETQANIGDESGLVSLRFQLRPEGRGVHFYTLRVTAAEGANEKGTSTEEATLANNRRRLVVDRTKGPYRVLYVSGRPNWEFKFLRRALEEDEEADVVGLIRIANREPKFDFRSRAGERTNPLFRGFDNADEDTAEQYDQPVLLRIGTVDEAELRNGFPDARDQLFAYDAVIIDDLESEFFTQDQMTLLQDFVSRRGGGFLMLGGQESFANGKYRRTPIEEMLPVYLEPAAGSTTDARGYRLDLSREGHVEPWVRLRKTQEAERKRLEKMPRFQTVNSSRGIKPGATILARAVNAEGAKQPALVTQRFGKGRTGAILVGDLWRWALSRKSPEENDQAKAWRQTIRWLVGDVPRRVEAEFKTQPGFGRLRLDVRLKDENYEPLENAEVEIEVTPPDSKETVELRADASDREAGLYTASYTSLREGDYRAKVSVRSADGDVLPTGLLAWTSDPTSEEFRRIDVDRDLLTQVAKESGGRVVSLDELDDFVSELQREKTLITEPWSYPLWHRWSVFCVAVLCLCAEWALRRTRGLP
ncbi:MAG: glutamine amidotransferase [Planctomycetota bacterium]